MSAAATAEVRGTGRSDEDLVASVRHGSDRAFEHLYERYHGRIFAYIVGMVRDHGRAEDLVQDAFMSSLRRMRENRSPDCLPPVDIRDRAQRLHRRVSP